MKKLLLHYWPELLITLAVWALVGWKMGLSAFFVTLMLSMLEITLSADNAVVNSRVLMKLSRFWQNMFLTVGIIIAVFIVRFILPVVMVAVATSIDVGTVFSLAMNNPEEYGRQLHLVAPIIDGFGGMFLFTVALFFFVDSGRGRQHHWIEGVERRLTHFARIRFSKLIAVTLSVALLIAILPEGLRATAGVAMVVGALTYVLLHSITVAMEHFSDDKISNKTGQVGWMAFALFMYLQVLDASFSLDGVVGAFAITNNIIIIMAGLGIGALWVRTMTIYMVRHETLAKYQLLESGAHWAIFALACVMILKLFGVELPELVIGSIGLVFVAGSVASSMQANKKLQVEKPAK